MSKTQKEINVAVDALQTFVQEFGTQDEYTKIVMEILLEELFDKKQPKKESEVKNGN